MLWLLVGLNTMSLDGEDEDEGEDGTGMPMGWEMAAEMMALPDYLVGLYVMEHQYRRLSDHIRTAENIGYPPEHTRSLIMLRWSTAAWLAYGSRQLRRN